MAFFFFNDTATTEIYTLSLHDALPICRITGWLKERIRQEMATENGQDVPHSAVQYARIQADRKSTRLNSSHTVISYAVFCLKKKKTNMSSRDYIHLYFSSLFREIIRAR